MSSDVSRKWTNIFSGIVTPGPGNATSPLPSIIVSIVGYGMEFINQLSGDNASFDFINAPLECWRRLDNGGIHRVAPSAIVCHNPRRFSANLSVFQQRWRAVKSEGITLPFKVMSQRFSLYIYMDVNIFHLPYLATPLKDRQPLVEFKLTVHGLHGVKPPPQPSHSLSYLKYEPRLIPLLGRPHLIFDNFKSAVKPVGMCPGPTRMLLPRQITKDHRGLGDSSPSVSRYYRYTYKHKN